jgi:lipopolysaccharide export system permease protein
VCPTRKGGGMGMNLTIGIAIAFGYVFFDKIFGTLAENLLFTIVAVWFQYYFRILAIFYFAMQNDKLKVTSIFI